MSALNKRPLKIGMKDAFALDLIKWTKGEEITSFSVTSNDNIEINGTNISGSRLSILATGLIEGRASVTFNYETATRKDSFDMSIRIIEA